MATSYQDDYMKTALRLPRELHAALMDAARDRGRSFNAEVIDRLQSSIALGGTAAYGVAPAGSSGSPQVSEMTRAASQINELQGQRNTLAIVLNAYGRQEEDEHARQIRAQMEALDLQIANLVQIIQSLRVEGVDLVTAGVGRTVIEQPPKAEPVSLPELMEQSGAKDLGQLGDKVAQTLNPKPKVGKKPA